MSDESGGLDVLETLALAGVVLGERLDDGVPLGGSRRSLVLRAARADGTSVVIKRFAPEDEPDPGADGFTREVTGLALLGRTPELLSADEEHQLVVMSDLGAHPTLADRLRGDDPDAAWRGALDWAGALGELVAGASSAVGQARERLGSDRERTHRELDQRVRLGIDRLAATAAVPVPDGGGDEVVAAVAALAGPGREVLSPGDTCPDNVLLTPAGPMFVDLEGTDVKPIAFDAAYALLPFATCWCVYAQPPGLTDAMLASFTEGVRARAPELITPGWEREVVTASTVWVLWMSSVLLNHTADPERRMGPREAPALTMRQLVQLRLDWVSQRAADVLPVTAALAADAGAALRAGWGELPVPVYPAWDGCC